MYSKIKLLALLSVTSLALFACGTGTSDDSSTVSSQMESASSMASSMASSSSEMRTFTLEQLSQYNGKNGNKAYVAVDGVVYDVTDVPAWANGEHKNGLTAGNELSDEILSSPHGKKVLEILPVVGTFVE